MLAKIGPRRNLNWRTPGRLVLLDHLGAGDVRGHQVGGELDPVEGQVQRIGQRADHQRLGQARHADQQAVAAGEDGDEQLLEDRVLADDDLAHLVLELVEGVLEPLDGGEVVVLEWLGCRFVAHAWNSLGRRLGRFDHFKTGARRVGQSLLSSTTGLRPWVSLTISERPEAFAGRHHRSIRGEANGHVGDGHRKEHALHQGPRVATAEDEGQPLSFSGLRSREERKGQHATLGQRERPARVRPGQVTRPDPASVLERQRH